MTLAASCISKVRAPADALAGWRALAPGRLRELRIGRWLPAVTEGVLALALLVPGWPGRVAPIAAASLFTVFAVALAAAQRRAEPGECGCFGSFSREPITRLSVVRTTCLAAVAALAARTGWPHPGLVHALTTASGRDLATGLLGAAVGVLALLLSVLWGQARAAGTSHVGSMSAVGPGDQIPEIEVVAGDGTPVLLADLRRGAGLVVLVAKAGCAPCAEVLAELGAWQENLGAGAHIRIVTSSPRAEFEAEHPELAAITYSGALETRRAFGVEGMPAAVLLGADGRVATPVAHGTLQIRGLLAGTANAVQAHSSPST